MPACYQQKTPGVVSFYDIEAPAPSSRNGAPSKRPTRHGCIATKFSVISDPESTSCVRGIGGRCRGVLANGGMDLHSVAVGSRVNRPDGVPRDLDDDANAWRI